MTHTRYVWYVLLFTIFLPNLLHAQVRGEEKVVFDFDCKAELQEVSFKGTAGADYITIHHDYEPYSAIVAPHWTKGSTELKPVGYVAGNSAQVEATFTFTCENVAQNKVYAKGTGPDGFDFPVQVLNISGVTGTYNVQKATKAFTAKTVDYYDKFAIKWQVSFDDEKTWKDAGTSENPLYVPLSQLNGCNLDDERVFYSTIHYGCAYAKGLTAQNEIIAAIFKIFESTNFPRIDSPKSGAMMYWGDKNPMTSASKCRGLKGLLEEEDARCGEWSEFFMSCVGLHGIKGCGGSILAPNLTINAAGQADIIQFKQAYQNTFGTIAPPYPIISNTSFLVKKWSNLTNKTMYISSGSWPYQNISLPYVAPNGNIIPVGDLNGTKAQGVNDPESVFSDHVVVCHNNKIYDPSYGTGPFNNINEWESNSLAAYAIYTQYVNSNMQTIHLVWVYDQEIPTINQTKYSCK